MYRITLDSSLTASDGFLLAGLLTALGQGFRVTAKLERVDRGDRTVLFLETAWIQEALDPLPGRHDRIVAALGTNLQIRLPILFVNHFIAVLAPHPESIGDVRLFLRGVDRGVTGGSLEPAHVYLSKIRIFLGETLILCLTEP